nr:transposase [uncultured Actinoplanes sp.]
MIDASGTVLQRRIRHDVAGLAELDLNLGAYAGGLRLAIERAEGLLVEHLHCREVPVYCISPKISARARERYRMSAAKSDALDAFVLADTLRHEHRHWRPLAVPSPLLGEMRAVIRDRQRVALCPRLAAEHAGLPGSAGQHWKLGMADQQTDASP